MDRQRRSASKIIDYRKYHLSGDLDQVVHGKVSSTIELLQNTILGEQTINMSLDENATPAELQELLKEQRESSNKLQQQAEAMKLRNELKAECPTTGTMGNSHWQTEEGQRADGSGT